MSLCQLQRSLDRVRPRSLRESPRLRDPLIQQHAWALATEHAIGRNAGLTDKGGIGETRSIHRGQLLGRGLRLKTPTQQHDTAEPQCTTHCTLSFARWPDTPARSVPIATRFGTACVAV